MVAAPWNRIAIELFPGIVKLGFVGVSASGPRTTCESTHGLCLANIHCDVLKWASDGPRFRQDAKIALELAEHLCARRTGLVDSDEPTGILTHHVDLDEPSWQFLARFADYIGQHCAPEWVHPRTVFDLSQNGIDVA